MSSVKRCNKKFETKESDDSSSHETDSTELQKKTKKKAKYSRKKSNQDNESISNSVEDDNSTSNKSNKSQLLQKESGIRSSFSKHKSDTKYKKSYNVRKGNNKNKESECSDSEVEEHEKSTEKRKKGHTSSKLVSKSFSGLFQEETDSSSGKEFQVTKFSRDGSKIMKKLSEIKGDYTKSNLASTKSAERKDLISKKQCLRFKSSVTKIFHKFKEVCSEYELRMESVKWKHFKKDLIYQESAKNIINKSKDVISKLKMELDAQEKELVNFYKQWYQECNLENDEDSSSSENETLQIMGSKEKPDELKNKDSSQKENVVSECDNEEIFSENESDARKKEGKHSVPKSSLINCADSTENVLSSDDGIASPILGNNKKKKSEKLCVKSKLEMMNASKKNSTEFLGSEDEQINSSVKDIFEETTTENTDAVNSLTANENETDRQNIEEKSETINNEAEIEKRDSNEDETLTKSREENVESTNDDLSTEVAKSMISESLSSQDNTEYTTSLQNERSENNSLNELNEEKAKRALLESDSESFLNEESSSEKSNRASIEDNLQKKCATQFEKIKSHTEEENKTKTDSTHKDNPSNKENETDKEQISVKRTPLDLDSDNSLNSFTRDTSDKKQSESDNSDDMRAKAKLLVSFNSESSNSDDEDELRITTDLSSNKQNRKDSRKKDTLKDDDVESDLSIGEKVRRRRRNINKKYDFETEKKLKMKCQVVLERLPEKSLEKYKNALSKSRQYLLDKEVDSLINVDRLNKNCNTASDTIRNCSSKKKGKAAKEVEDSLLDHLKKVENGEFNENPQDDSGSENNALIIKPQSVFMSKEALMKEADKVAKNMLLYSDSDIGEQKDDSDANDSEKEKDKVKEKRKKMSPKKESTDSTTNKDDNEQEKSAWRRHALLTMKISSDSDSDVDGKKLDKKRKELREENNIENLADKEKSVKHKRRIRRKILDSDSDVQITNANSNSDSSLMSDNDKSSNSSIGKTKSRKRKTRKSSDSDSSLPQKRSKQKRKRIKNMDTDSDSSSNNDKITSSQGTPGKKGRKNIRRVIKDKQVADDTKQAAKEEEERLKRIAERQKLYNEMYEARLAGEEKVEKLVLDFDPETKDELLSVHPNLVKRLKPHQAKGIKFMWDSCFESLERITSSSGSGCIIAHCMGLGKTLQVITLIHTLLTYEKTGVRTIMIVCPLSTVLNWVNEFNLWLKDIENYDDIEIYELTKLKKNIERKYQLESWQRTGGVLIIGYEMFRNLTGTNNKMRKKMKEDILQYLVDPGPDLIVCDEGHLLKNEDTALSKSMKRIKTLRRIVLTGTPLQNNLIEYHCMVQFVKPSLLGTRKEFLNRFVNPITNGQFDDSTEYDVKLMKKRAYVLHKMLKGCVQRFDYSVLMPFLPPKQEYVIFVRLTDVQIKMYQYYLDNFARRLRSASGSLFADFQALQRIWTHPLVLRLNAEKIEKMNERKLSCSESEGSLKDFINDNSDTDTESTASSSASDSDGVKSIKSTVASTRSTRRNNNTDVDVIPKTEEIEKKEEEWWTQFIEPEHFEDMKVSAKLVLLFGILKECEQIGDKVLVFSQSLYSLTLIEQFLEKIDNDTQEGTSSEYIEGHSGSWSLGLDYFRLDGQTSPENRSIWCKIFNEPSNSRARLFLISTRAGGLGINLTAANRVIIFDASWNPSHDVQSIFRVYRFGQKKPCYVYRFLAAGTMEEKIYNRQVTKLSLACRVVDEQQIERHYSNNDLSELYKFDLYTNVQGERPTLNLPKDRLLAEIFLKYKNLVENYHEHDSLLENKAEEELNEEERKQAWLEYEEEKKGPRMQPYQMIPNLAPNVQLNQFNLPSQLLNINTDFEKLKELIRKDYPNATPEQQQLMTTRALADMYRYLEQQTFHNATNRVINQNTSMGIRPTILPRMQIPNLVRMPHVIQNTNNLSGQIRNERPFTFTNPDPRSGNGEDDDIVEVSPTVTDRSKNKEE
ncbi:uncharacterized protein LOC143182745 [Calliopsis andreniformis]|uniref:uncharacterized protein LOC143182745 n=1 Tax=Calliopsis andreniformis TaxID=337506 RepID=UPI003FCDD003